MNEQKQITDHQNLVTHNQTNEIWIDRTSKNRENPKNMQITPKSGIKSNVGKDMVRI